MATKAKILKDAETRTLIAIVADEDTVTGYLLTGIGDRNHRGETNFIIVDESTPQKAIEEAFEKLLSRNDIALILVAQKIADREVRHLISAHTKMPSKDCPYAPENDSELIKAARQLYGSDRAIPMLKKVDGPEEKKKSKKNKEAQQAE
jgi:V-type H+-transporting ATPase subunit F